jgi:uncharacterized protein (DUF885 family)
MQKIKRLLAFFLTAALAISLVSGCSALVPGQTPEPAATTAAPIETAASVETAAPTVVPNGDSLALAQLDMEIFGDYATSDALTYHLTVAHPENFPELVTPETGWGTFTYADSAAATEDERAYLARLDAIDRGSLTVSEQLTYDTLKQYLNWSIESFDYYYYGEVLDTLVGLHSNLPLNMVFYDMDSVEDVEDYLTLLADTPRLMNLVLVYEQEKSAAGLFMTDSALDQVLGQLQDVIDAKETLFLHATFDEAIDGIVMTDAQRADFQTRNDGLVDALVDSYQALYDGLEPLRGTGTNEAGLCAYGDEGLRYFELGLRDNACSTITPEEAKTILNDEIAYQISVIQECAAREPSVFDDADKISLSLGTTQENLDYLETLMDRYFPELPEHAVTFMDCPEELEDQFSPAAYLVPPVDDASENLIILNEKTLEGETRLLDTLAHEGYPGHMYHYQYIRTLVEQTGYARQVFDLTGYYECWSQAAEVFFDTYNTRFSSYYCRFMHANSDLSNLLLPALFSIEVNYYGATVEDLQTRIAQYYDDDTAAELAPVYYQYAVENPFYFLKYAMGYTMFQQELRKAQSACGTKFDRLDYNKTFLDLGPTYFNFILPVMDEWIEAHK